MISVELQVLGGNMVIASQPEEELHTIEPSQFKLDQSVLDNALGLGLNMLYACREGKCLQCKCRLLDGRMEYFYPHPVLKQGEFVACRTFIDAHSGPFSFEQIP